MASSDKMTVCRLYSQDEGMFTPCFVFIKPNPELIGRIETMNQWFINRKEFMPHLHSITAYCFGDVEVYPEKESLKQGFIPSPEMGDDELEEIKDYKKPDPDSFEHPRLDITLLHVDDNSFWFSIGWKHSSDYDMTERLRIKDFLNAYGWND